jgi:hypothetical protein
MVILKNAFRWFFSHHTVLIVEVFQESETNRLLENIFEAYKSRSVGPVCGRKTNQ